MGTWLELAMRRSSSGFCEPFAASRDYTIIALRAPCEPVNQILREESNGMDYPRERNPHALLRG